jgi:endoglucanase
LVAPRRYRGAMNTTQVRRLERLLTLPTAPFREHAIAKFAIDFCTRAGIPCFADPLGNVVVGARDAAGYRRAIGRRTGEPLRLFVAHMDHPGLHGVEWASANRLRASWLGGSPVKHLRGARLWLADESGYVGRGTITSYKLHEAGYAMTDVNVRVEELRSSAEPQSLFGGLAFRKPVWRSRRRVYTKAADDLVGVFAVLQTAKAYWQRSGRRATAFLGLLTRGEEVGFVGAVGHLGLGWLAAAARPLLCISLETSRTLPGAVIGSGPVVRLGDRRTVFDPNGLAVLTRLAETTLPGRHQRRIMDGGSCEATAATAWGLPAIGLSVPLGNYHNQGFEGGPDCRAPEGPAPEMVHLDDVEDLLRLCRALMRPKLPWHDAWADTRTRLRKGLGRHETLLRRFPIR